MGGTALVSPEQLLLPPGLPALVTEGQMRREVIRLLIMIPFIDQRVSAEKASVVTRAAAMLEVKDNGTYNTPAGGQATARPHHRWHSEPLDPDVLVRGWQSPVEGLVDMVFVMLPVLTLGRRELRAKYQALEDYRPGSLGKVLYSYYRSNCFAMPGERGGFPEKFVLHECYHILGSYPVNHQGEMLAGAFTGGNVEKLCMDVILLSLLQYQVGVRVAGVTPGIPGQLKPNEFFHAIARGAAMRVNLMDGWDFWEHAERPLADLRDDYGLPQLMGTETFEPLVVTPCERKRLSGRRPGPGVGCARSHN